MGTLTARTPLHTHLSASAAGTQARLPKARRKRGEPRP